MAEGRAPRATEPEFVSAVAHELRTPIAAVRAAAAQLRGSSRGLDAETRERLLGIIQRAADQLLRLADDLALAAETGARRLDVHSEVCDAREISEQAIAAAVAARAGADITLVAPDHTPAVFADAARLQQVLANLVDNALSHGGPGVHVTLSLEPAPPSLRLKVADDGPGIPPELTARVFEPHTRLGQRAGSGLGLWIVQQLVTGMAGSVTLETEPGLGSTFIVELPLA